MIGHHNLLTVLKATNHSLDHTKKGKNGTLVIKFCILHGKFSTKYWYQTC